MSSWLACFASNFRLLDQVRQQAPLTTARGIRGASLSPIVVTLVFLIFSHYRVHRRSLQTPSLLDSIFLSSGESPLVRSFTYRSNTLQTLFSRDRI